MNVFEIICLSITVCLFNFFMITLLEKLYRKIQKRFKYRLAIKIVKNRMKTGYLTYSEGMKRIRKLRKGLLPNE